MGATLQDTLNELQAMQQQATAPKPPPPPPPKPVIAPPPPPPKGIGEQITDTANSAVAALKGIPAKVAGYVQNTTPQGAIKDAAGVLKGAEAGISRAVPQFVGGIADTATDAGVFFGNTIQPAMLRAGASGPAARAYMPESRPVGASLADRLSLKAKLGAIGNPAANQFVTEGLASSIPFAIPGAPELNMLRAATGAAIGLTAPNPSDRVVNFAAGAATEGALNLAGMGGRAVLKTVIKKATPAEGAADALDRSFATQRTNEARAKAQEATLKGEPPEAEPQESINEGTRAGDPPPASEGVQAPAKGSKPPVPPLIKDANEALAASGAAHEVTPENIELTSDGRIKVPPAAKEAADAAGHGRAFAAANEMDRDAVIFKEEATDGSSRIVGNMGREDLAGFAADVAHLRANPQDISLPADHPQGQWKVPNIASDVDSAAAIRAAIETLPEPKVRASTDNIMATARAVADATGRTPEEAIAFARGVAGDTTDLPTALKATQALWVRAGNEVDKFTNGIDWEHATDQQVLDAANSIHQLHMIAAPFQEAKAATGQGLQVLGLPDADSYMAGVRTRGLGHNGGPELEPPPIQAGDVPQLPRTREELKDWLAMWDALKGNEAGRQKFLQGIKTYPSASLYLRQSLANFYTGAILSAPHTIMTNVLMPAFFGGLRTIERMSGAIAGSINPLISGADRQAFRDMAVQAPIAYVQSLADIGDAFRGALHAYDNGSVLAPHSGNPMDFKSSGVPQPIIAAAQADGKLALPYHLGNLLNYFPQVIFKLHGSANETALHMAYMGEVRAKAMLEASTAKLDPAASRALVSQRLDEAISNADGTATDASSIDSAHRTTLVRTPDPDLQPGMSAFQRTVASWRQNFPELRYVLPILQVPANGLGETLRRLPGAGFLLKESSQELSGSLGAFRQADAYGRMMLGAGTLLAGGLLARAGMLTGAGPQDPHDRALWLTQHQPYSFRIGGKPGEAGEWLSYAKMDPIGPLLGIVAGHYDNSVYQETDKDTTLAAVGALAEYLKDRSALKGVSDLLNFGGSPEDTAVGQRFMGGLAGGFVPAFLQVPRTAFDPDQRVRRNPWDYIKSALPGASATLDPVRNLLGEPVHKPQDTFVENMLPVTMSPISSYQQDPVLDELDRLYSKTGYAPGALSPAAGAQGHFDYRDVKLEDGKSLYNALMKARTTTEVDGVPLRQALTDLINSDEYAEAKDGTGKVGDEDNGPRDDTRGGMIQKVFQQYTAQTKQDVAKASPIAARWMAVARIKSDANDALRGTPAADIVKNPKLLDALGISLESYEAKLKGDQ